MNGMQPKKFPMIAIVGRPNVGKSSLFNRMAGTRKAIVESASGTTRDRLYTDIGWKGKTFTIVDTGGFDTSKIHDITPLILKQLENAIAEADVILFVVDARTGVTHQDTELASRLRKVSKKIFLAVNKSDDAHCAAAALDFFELGLGEPYAVSATTGRGVEKLIDAMTAAGGAASGNIHRETEVIGVAIVGRPNVGKSSYLNAILKEERAIVHDVAGTTRDALDTDFELEGRHYRLIDTAGMRHNMKLGVAADFYGSVRAREAIKRADVAMVLIDGMDGLREDDERVIDFCMEEGKAVILAVNKWDLVKNMDTVKYKEMLIRKMNAIKNIPVVFISCKTSRNVAASIALVRPLYEKAAKVFVAVELGEVLALLNDSREVRNRRVKFEYLKQDPARPMKFVLGMKNTRLANENLRRYAENFLRASRDFEGMPIEVAFEKRQRRS